MAGDWIKMRSDLQTHPKVVRISSALKADRLRVVGGLHAVWSLFDVHSEDGVLEGYTPDALDDLIGFSGFSDSMISVGWLSTDGESLMVPRFDEHNGQSAKRRSQETQRKREARKTSAPNEDKLRSREEKRREEQTEGTNTVRGETGASDAPIAQTRAVDLSVAMRESGIESSPSDPRLQALAEQGVTADTVRAASQQARAAKPKERISTGYIVSIVQRWAAEATSVKATGAQAPSGGRPSKFDPVAFVNRNRPSQSNERTDNVIDVEAKQVA